MDISTQSRKNKRIFILLALFTAGICSAETLIDLQDRVSINPARLAERTSGESRTEGDGLPAHVRYSFDDDKLSNPMVFHERQVLVIPVGNYRALFVGKAKKSFDLRLRGLKQVIHENIGDSVREIPVFPIPNQEEVFHAQNKILKFQGGTGVRFITRFGTEKTVSTNDNLIYTFQGISKDGRLLVCFFYPIAVRNLPISEDASTGALFMDQQDPDRFTPNLDLLDQAVQLVQIKN